EHGSLQEIHVVQFALERGELEFMPGGKRDQIGVIPLLEAAQRRVVLKINSDDKAKVYLNSKLIYQGVMDGGTHNTGEDVAADVDLKAGFNVLVFKVVHLAFCGWSGSVRFTDGEGNTVNGIKVTLTPPETATAR